MKPFNYQDTVFINGGSRWLGSKEKSGMWNITSGRMKKVGLMMLVFTVHQAISQTQPPGIGPTVEKFQQHYNNGDYDSIFHGFSSSMQDHLPQDQTRDFFGALNSDAGRILKREAVHEGSNQALYKTTFERGVFALDLSLDPAGLITGLVIKPYAADSLPVLKRNVSKLTLPFKGSWTVVWGGDTKELNYHVENRAQKNAFDFLIVGDKGKAYRTDGQTNEDYYAFGQEITAPCEGEVVMVVNGIKDNQPGEMNPVYIPGNTVILKTAAGEHLVFAHFKNQSIVVRPGEKVMQGQLLGLCGNSGNSTEPHLHFHLQNVEEMQKATGAKMYFDKILVQGELKSDYSPVKGEVVQAADNQGY